jgi:hypothetical protein
MADPLQGGVGGYALTFGGMVTAERALDLPEFCGIVAPSSYLLW